MAGTPVDIANRSLGMLGEQRIGSLDDDTPRARQVKTFYDSTVRETLRFANWAFARTQAELPQIDETPLFGFTFSHALPDDYLMVRLYGGDRLSITSFDDEGNQLVNPWPPWPGQAYPYKIYAGKRLYSYTSKAFIVYTALVDVGQFDPMYEEGLVMKLASYLAYAIPKDTEKGDAFAERAFNLLIDAAAVCGQEGSTDVFISNDLSSVRNYNSYSGW